jgi:hypothetical protein
MAFRPSNYFLAATIKYIAMMATKYKKAILLLSFISISECFWNNNKGH